ncbi:MAG: hypothetical protein IKM67_04905, partial [Clostridia bacterium]|nr:hypothetical protein [Clostridia bacterium]MBR3866036.1 hypothetical protein [Clostridia bacterium]
LYGHAPDKNTSTRRFSAEKTAKPHRSAEPKCRKEPSFAQQSGSLTVSAAQKVERLLQLFGK